MNIARFAILCVPAFSGQQLVAQAPSTEPPVRQVYRILARTDEVFPAVTSIRELPDGRVLVNDGAGRKVVMFDNNLGSRRVIADTTTTTAKAYGNARDILIPYLSDTTILVDPAAVSMVLIDGQGKLARTIALPRPQDMNLILSPQSHAVFDPQGRLLYRTDDPHVRIGPRDDKGVYHFLAPTAESTAVVRAAFGSHSIDTVAMLRAPIRHYTSIVSLNGSGGTSTHKNPLESTDDWIALATGEIAVIRAADYRLTLFGAGTAPAQTIKIAHTWEHLSDSAKEVVMDSVRRADSIAFYSGRPNGAAPWSTTARFYAISTIPGDEKPEDLSLIGAPGRIYAAPSELPDYRPAFVSNSAMLDASGRIWLESTIARQSGGGSIFDVIDVHRGLVDRVEVPTGMTVVGLGRGVLYVTVREASGAAGGLRVVKLQLGG